MFPFDVPDTQEWCRCRRLSGGCGGHRENVDGDASVRISEGQKDLALTLRHTLARLFSMEQLSPISLLPLTPSAVLFVFGPASPHSLHRSHMHHTASAFSTTWGIWCQCSVCCGETQPSASSLQSSELRQSSININNAHCLCSRFGFGTKIKLMVLINLIHMHALILNILFHDNLQFCREKNVSEIGHWHRLNDFDELFIQRRNGIHL